MLSLPTKHLDSHSAGNQPQLASVGEALASATSTLTDAGVASARLDAEVLLADVLGWNRAKLYATPELGLGESQHQAFLTFIQRRQRREPVAYIIGHREFFGIDFIVSRTVLIPRPETELLVELALESAARLDAQGQRLLLADIGTGSGAVAVSLATNLPTASVYATEASAQALGVASLNAARHGVSSRVQLLLGDLLDPLPQRMHIITANLPYIRTAQLAALIPEVADYEPRVALDGGADGLVHIRRLLVQARRWLLPHGVVLLEIGADQGQVVLALSSVHFTSAKVELFQDHAGLDRVVRIST